MGAVTVAAMKGERVELGVLVCNAVKFLNPLLHGQSAALLPLPVHGDGPGAVRWSRAR